MIIYYTSDWRHQIGCCHYKYNNSVLDCQNFIEIWDADDTNAIKNALLIYIQQNNIRRWYIPSSLWLAIWVSWFYITFIICWYIICKDFVFSISVTALAFTINYAFTLRWWKQILRDIITVHGTQKLSIQEGGWSDVQMSAHIDVEPMGA